MKIKTTETFNFLINTKNYCILNILRYTEQVSTRKEVLMKKYTLLLIGFLKGCTLSVFADNYLNTDDRDLTVAQAYIVLKGDHSTIETSNKFASLVNFLSGMRTFAQYHNVLVNKGTKQDKIEICLAGRNLLTYQNIIFRDYEEGKTKGDETFSIEFFRELEKCLNMK